MGCLVPDEPAPPPGPGGLQRVTPSRAVLCPGCSEELCLALLRQSQTEPWGCSALERGASPAGLCRDPQHRAGTTSHVPGDVLGLPAPRPDAQQCAKGSARDSSAVPGPSAVCPELCWDPQHHAGTLSRVPGAVPGPPVSCWNPQSCAWGCAGAPSTMPRPLALCPGP